ncbi:MAG TPA: STAS domain-containing protein [Candidatus Acidoferrales bacterium]|nr:STAS domain-containing protein [Candidatus Acidoferrales bacterium]
MSSNSADSKKTAFRLETSTQQDAVIVRCVGKLTVEHAEILKNHVKTLIPHKKRIILDLNEITHMDSSGLGTLVSLYVSARKGNCDLLLVNYSKPVRNLLGLTNLLSVFETAGRHGAKFP